MATADFNGDEAAGGHCTINVIFAPTQGGSRNGARTVTDNAPGSPQSVALEGTGEDFSFGVSSGGTSTASVSPGGTATYTLSFAGLGGMNQTVNFTCTGAPSEATCAVSPSSVTPNGSGAVSVSVSVTTTAPGLAAPRVPRLPLALVRILGVLLLLALPVVLVRVARELRYRRPLRWALAMGAATVLALAMAACGGGGNGSQPPNSGTPGGSYPLTVTGTVGSGSTAVQHSVSLTLTVS